MPACSCELATAALHLPIPVLIMQGFSCSASALHRGAVCAIHREQEVQEDSTMLATALHRNAVCTILGEQVVQENSTMFFIPSRAYCSSSQTSTSFYHARTRDGVDHDVLPMPISQAQHVPSDRPCCIAACEGQPGSPPHTWVWEA